MTDTAAMGIVTAISIGVFLLAFWRAGVVPCAKSAVAATRDAMLAMRDPSLDERAREHVVQTMALRLAGISGSLILRNLAALIVGYVPIVAADWLGFTTQAAVLSFMTRWAIFIFSRDGRGHARVRGRRRSARMAALNAYSALDRFVHRIAFLHPGVQIAAADIEDRLFARDLDGIEIGAPIFITSLPRAGTTILLAALDSIPEVATHIYRDMPFVLAPLLWSRLCGRFRRQAVLHERAHGDGIAIGYDSPEAFEEVIWRCFWPEHFDSQGITLWSATEANADAREFMTRHFRKIVALRCKHAARPSLRLRKNNANIARLDLIAEMFPTAAVLVPLRSPLAHAGSLRRQHENFLRLHGEDAFTLRYMADIGHYEFGALHRPIRFQESARLPRG